MIGAFYQPQCVIIDTDTLSTLPDRELASGIAEIVKYGLIRCVLPPFPCIVLPLSSLHLLFLFGRALCQASSLASPPCAASVSSRTSLVSSRTLSH